MNEGVIVVITIPLACMAIAIAVLLYLYKSRVRKLEALVKIVELGGNPDPEMMAMLSHDGNKSYKSDYKYGLIWLAVGIPMFTGMAFESGLGEATFGLIPVLIGIAFLISGKYRLRESS